MCNTVSVIIPTLNAENELPILFKALKCQRHPIHEVIVVDSESTDHTVSICRNEREVKLLQISRDEFDHGKTRDMAFRVSTGGNVVFLTQDAVPANEDFLSNLIEPLSMNEVAVSTGRQLPKENASKMERLIRQYNYPTESYIRSKEDLYKMGIKTFFCSDVCAAYSRQIYFQLGGFDFPVKTNEDMFFAAKVINAGFKLAYAADAVVLHSHNFSLSDQYRRNYIQGYEIERHRELLCDIHQKSEGVKLVKYVGRELLKHGYLGSFAHFCFDCSARFLGSRAGEQAYKSEIRQRKMGDNNINEDTSTASTTVSQDTGE